MNEGTKKVYDFLKESKVYYLATVEGDKARVRPFGTIEIFDDKLYIQTGKVKDVSKQIKANPNVEICGMVGPDKWVRVYAKAHLDERIEAQEHMLEAYPSLANRYKPGDGNTEVFYLTDVEAVFSSFTTEPETYTF